MKAKIRYLLSGAIMELEGSITEIAMAADARIIGTDLWSVVAVLIDDDWLDIRILDEQAIAALQGNKPHLYPSIGKDYARFASLRERIEANSMTGGQQEFAFAP